MVVLPALQLYRKVTEVLARSDRQFRTLPPPHPPQITDWLAPNPVTLIPQDILKPRDTLGSTQWVKCLPLKINYKATNLLQHKIANALVSTSALIPTCFQWSLEGWPWIEETQIFHLIACLPIITLLTLSPKVSVTSDKSENAVPWVGALTLTWGTPHPDSEAQLQNRANGTDLPHWGVHLCVCVNTIQRAKMRCC